MSVTVKEVRYPNWGWETAALLMLPPSIDQSKQYPAMLSAHPIGSCKEQTSSNIYGRALAEAGYVVLAFDASFQGESGGQPRWVEDPELRVADFRFSIDFLQTLPYVDAERIGILGICGGGGYALNAHQTDYRSKVCIGITPVNFGRLTREAFTQHNPVDGLEKMARQRTLEAQGAQRNVNNLLPADVETARKMTSDPDITQATEYYKTPRGEKPNGATQGLFSFNSAAAAWDAFNHCETIMTKPFMVVVGSIPGAFGSYRDANEVYGRAAAKDKEIVILDGVSHYDLYDLTKATKPALEKIIPFLEKHLNT
ncbi:hypothetical protein JCM24511_09599 [Saitozyma sp. JCM 24511]|nr:hypothetical protein JCM24511_09599 [Saitozyma sp. JCM 24511]